MESQPFLFERMVSVAALLHILDNASKDVHMKLTSRATFLTHLMAIMSLLFGDGPRQAFLHRVVKGGGHHRHAGLFEKTFEQHSDHRWNSILLTLSWLLPLTYVLTEVWSEETFGVYNSKDKDFSVKAITKAICSAWFWAFAKMLKVVEACIEDIGTWADNCPCHSNMWARRKMRVG